MIGIAMEGTVVFTKDHSRFLESNIVALLGHDLASSFDGRTIILNFLGWMGGVGGWGEMKGCLL